MTLDKSLLCRKSWSFLGVAMLLGLHTIASAAPARMVGKVVDEDGKPVSNLTVRFTQEGGQAEPATAAVRKKGRFTRQGLRPGKYRIDLVDSDLFIVHLDFRMTRADGLTVGEGRVDGHPSDGVQGIPISGQNDVDLTLTVAPKQSKQARERQLAVALPALSVAAELYNQGKFEQTVAEAERILSEDPELGEAHYVHGLALEKVERYAEAETALGEAIERIPDYERIWAVLGEVTMRLAAQHDAAGRAEDATQAYARAVESLTEAVRRDPNEMASQLNLSASLDRSGDDARLQPVLEGILEKDPTQLPSRLRLASLYSRQGKFDQALEQLNQIPDTEKRVAVTIYNIAVGLNDDGDIEGSLMAARRAAEIDPQLSHAKRLIAQILLGKGDNAASALAIREFLEVAADDPEADIYRRILEKLEE